MIFAKRYESLIFHGENHELRDDICGEIDFRIRQKLVSIMEQFAQPVDVQYDRYDDSRVEKSDALMEACNSFNDIMGVPYAGYNPYPFGESGYRIAPLCMSFIFSIIELQYDFLHEHIKDEGQYFNPYSEQYEFNPDISDEKKEFSKAINSFLDENSIPWRILDGKMIKIDAQQFECDLKLKALAQMQELKDAEPKFQSAYTELTTAVEALENGDYQSAINNAGKSYESVLKVILGVDTGNANQLTQAYRDTLLKEPATMQTGGFESQVMKSLPFIRNNSGSDHGAGAKEVVISKPMAKLAVNLAAALDTYLIEEYMQDTASSN